LFGSAAASWPLDARAQQSDRMRRVGVLMAYPQDDAEAQNYVSAFRDALKDLGWVEGRNFSMIEYWAGPEVAPIQQAARDLTKQEPDVILSSSTPTTAALIRQTGTIPIVFAIVSDPIGSGFVKTFANPGGNATGFTNLDASMGGKWLELLKDIVPEVRDAAFLFNPTTASYANFYLPSFISAGELLGIVAHAAPVANDEDIDRIVATQAGSPHNGIVVMTDSFTSSHRQAIIRSAAQYRVPASVSFLCPRWRAPGLWQ